MEITATMTYTLACLLAGEAGAMPLPAQIGVAHVAINRLDAGMGFDGWHGWDAASPRTMMVADLALRLPDTTGGAMYALSRDDVEMLGFGEGGLVYLGPGGLETHLYWNWPGEGNHGQTH